jgi:hypothetical protein
MNDFRSPRVQPMTASTATRTLRANFGAVLAEQHGLVLSAGRLVGAEGYGLQQAFEVLASVFRVGGEVPGCWARKGPPSRENAAC